MITVAMSIFLVIFVKISIMSLNEILILIAIGFLAGTISGSLGVGGAVLIVPALVIFMGFSQHQAQGTSLAVLLLPIGILATINYARNGYVNWKYALIISLVFVIGAYVGSVISINLPEKVLKKVFAVFMMIVAIKMIFSK
jgi:uncharacterized protein